MDRRTFLQSTVAGALAAVPGSPAAAGEARAGKTGKTGNDKKEKYNESAREIPIVEHADVLVAGGGPAGVAAAITGSPRGSVDGDQGYSRTDSEVVNLEILEADNDEW